MDQTSGKVLFGRRVEDERLALVDLIDDLEQLVAERGPVTVGIGVLGGIAGLLAAMPAEATVDAVDVPGVAVNHARPGSVGGECQRDPGDAAATADQVRVPRHPRVGEADQEIDFEIRLLVSRRRELVIDQALRISRVRELPASIHPGLEWVVDPR